ncbi:ketopantoate reductase family protein [Pseudactinotalea sp. Z1732]|uniref:ketopantoate reductase family protein n=1 Tax=Micrococcales TaxID=85006 RepID=UPI003C7AEC38
MTRYVVIGAGAVGGTIAGRLAHRGHQVVLVARGEHLAALRRDGLRLRTPDLDTRLPVTAIGGPDDIELRPDDVLVLSTKTHQAVAALSQWADAPVPDGGHTAPAGARLPILTALNGVSSERMALRYFDRVFGVCVWLPAVHLHPGEVIARGTPQSGILHISRYPASRSEPADRVLLEQVRTHWSESGLGVELPTDVMPWKYHKLLSNIGNAFQAVLGPAADAGDLIDAARAEARAVLAGAGIEVASDDDEAAVRQASFGVGEVPGTDPDQLGGSSWQSLARGTGSIETDYLNGQIALIAREHGLAAPVNTTIAALARQAARTGTRPGAISASDLAAELGLDPLAS